MPVNSAVWVAMVLVVCLMLNMFDAIRGLRGSGDRLCHCVVLLFISFDVLLPFNVQGFISSCFGVAFAASVFGFWRVFKRTSFIKPWEIILIWFQWKKAEVDVECPRWEVDCEGVPKTAIGQYWDKLW